MEAASFTVKGMSVQGNTESQPALYGEGGGSRSLQASIGRWEKKMEWRQLRLGWKEKGKGQQNLAGSNFSLLACCTLG